MKKKQTKRSNFGRFYVSWLTANDISVNKAFTEYGKSRATFEYLLTREPEQMQGQSLEKLAKIVNVSLGYLLSAYEKERVEQEGYGEQKEV